jgi:small subunit ribosomal protein S3
MGNKVHPNACRATHERKLEIPSRAQAIWFKKKNEFADCLIEDIKIRALIEKHAPKKTVLQLNILRYARRNVTIKIFTSRPGTLIGIDGAEIKKLKAVLQKSIDSEINLKVEETYASEFDPQSICEMVEEQISTRKDHRRLIRSIQSRAEKAGIGLLIEIRGRIGGASIARKERHAIGSLGRQSLRSDVRSAQRQSLSSYGTCGIKVFVRQ